MAAQLATLLIRPICRRTRYRYALRTFRTCRLVPRLTQIFPTLSPLQRDQFRSGDLTHKRKIAGKHRKLYPKHKKKKKKKSVAKKSKSQSEGEGEGERV